MCAVRSEQWYGYAEFPRHSGQGLQIFRVMTVAAIFIFDLHGDNRSAAIVLQCRNLRQYHAPVGAHRIQKRFVAAPDLHFRMVHQPPGQPAVVAFTAGVRSRADDHMKPQFPGHAEKCFEVQVVLQPKPALFRFGEVPENVALDAVAAHGCRFLKPVTPAGTRQPEKMNHAGNDLHPFPGDLDASVFKFHLRHDEIFLSSFFCGCCRGSSVKQTPPGRIIQRSARSPRGRPPFFRQGPVLPFFIYTCQ